MRTRIDKCPKDALEIKTGRTHSRKGKNIISEKRWISSGVHRSEHTPREYQPMSFGGKILKVRREKRGRCEGKRVNNKR
jgi:hypothetical protein